MAETFFPYRIDPQWKPFLFPLRVGADDGVTVGADRVVATFGWWRVETTRENVAETGITGPHRWYTAVGLRLSFSDSGLTFGTNHHRGVCLEFHSPVPRVIGFRDHASLWVSVADPDGLVAALDE